MNKAKRIFFYKKAHLGSRSLSRELAISLILLLILFQGALLTYVYHRQSIGLKHELEKKADDLTANLSEVLIMPLWDYDDEQIGKIGMAFLEFEVIDEVLIKDASGKTLFHVTSGQGVQQGIRRSAKIVHRNQITGSVDLFFSLGALERGLGWLRNTIMLVLLASFIVIFITAGILLRIFMRHPLNILQLGIDRWLLASNCQFFRSLSLTTTILPFTIQNVSASHREKR